MNMDCVVIGTNLKNRFENLKKCTEFLDKYNFIVKNFKKLELKNVEDSSFLPVKDIEYFGSKLSNFLQNRVITKEINESHIFVKTLENGWNDNSIIGGKSC